MNIQADDSNKRAKFDLQSLVKNLNQFLGEEQQIVMASSLTDGSPVFTIEEADSKNGSSYQEHKLEVQKTPYYKETYNNMRKLAGKINTYSNYYDNEQIFYEQAKFLENFEDHYHNPTEFMMYRPNYMNLTIRQFRWYFTWRSMVRKGNITKTDSSYVRLYVSELINGAGVASPEQGFEKLYTFWEQYSKLDPTNNPFLISCILDYTIVFHCDLAYVQRFYEQGKIIDDALRIEDAISQKDYQKLVLSLDELSAYHVCSSKFYTSVYGESVAQAMAYVIPRLEAYYAKTRSKTLLDRLLGRRENAWWIPFPELIFYTGEPRTLPTGKVVLNKVREFCYDPAHDWSQNARFHADSIYIGKLLKLVEYALREEMDFRNKLKRPEMPARVTATVCNAVHCYCQENGKIGLAKRQKAKAKEALLPPPLPPVIVTIDTSKLAEIRRDAQLIQEQLIVDEPPEPPIMVAKPAPITPVQAAREDDEWEQLAASLDEVECQLLRSLLRGDSLSQALAQSAWYGLPEVLMEQLNEKAVAAVGDSILDESGIFEDYLDEIKRVL